MQLQSAMTRPKSINDRIRRVMRWLQQRRDCYAVATRPSHDFRAIVRLPCEEWKSRRSGVARQLSRSRNNQAAKCDRDADDATDDETIIKQRKCSHTRCDRLCVTVSSHVVYAALDIKRICCPKSIRLLTYWDFRTYPRIVRLGTQLPRSATEWTRITLHNNDTSRLNVFALSFTSISWHLQQCMDMTDTQETQLQSVLCSGTIPSYLVRHRLRFSSFLLRFLHMNVFMIRSQFSRHLFNLSVHRIVIPRFIDRKHSSIDRNSFWVVLPLPISNQLTVFALDALA